MEEIIFLDRYSALVTIRYQRRIPVAFKVEPMPIAERMGLDKVHLRVEEEA